MTNGLWQPVAKNCFRANLYFLLLVLFFEAPAKTYMYLWPWTLHEADSCAAAVSGINYSIEIKLSSLLESVFHWQFETKMKALMMHCRAYRSWTEAGVSSPLPPPPPTDLFNPELLSTAQFVMKNRVWCVLLVVFFFFFFISYWLPP